MGDQHFFAPQAQRALHRAIGEAEEHRVGRRGQAAGLPRRNHEGVARAEGQCRETGIDFAAYAAAGNDVEAIRDTLKLRPGIEMVLLSPSLGAPRSGGYLKRILSRITKPIVAISQQARANA